MSNLYTCPDCFGDGKETCHNPDHGFITMLSFHDVGRLGCPVCGHDERHKVKGGADCETCDGAGKLPFESAKFFCEGQYDFEEIMSACDPNFYQKIEDDHKEAIDEAADDPIRSEVYHAL